jgi:protein-S-isoprenylcysteine O-methyltransferase Ste14
LGWSLIGSAITILLAAWVHFYRAETDIRPDKPSIHIIRTGLYKYSRNPIYVCFLLLQAGIGLLMSNLWVLLLVPVAVLVLTKFVIAREEAYLERTFGDAYLNFKQSVRRWL